MKYVLLLLFLTQNLFAQGVINVDPWIPYVSPINGDCLIGSNNQWIAGACNGSGSATWGAITGLLSNQTDLQSALDAKQPTLSTYSSPANEFITGFNAPNTFVSSSIPGSSIPASVLQYYVATTGSDSNSGTAQSPWATVGHACSVIGTPTHLNPVVLNLIGSGSTEAGAVTCSPNIMFIGNYSSAYNVFHIGNSASFTVTGGASSYDFIVLNNINLAGTFSWIRSSPLDFALTVYFYNSLINGLFTEEQNGTSGIVLFAVNSYFENGITATAVTHEGELELTTTQVDGTFTTNVGYVDFLAGNQPYNATFNFQDPGSYGNFISSGSWISGAATFTGAWDVQLSGNFCDTGTVDGSPACTITTVTGSHGNPTFESDSGSLPSSITGTYTFHAQSFSKYESYVPTASTNWSTVPTTVQAALDSVRVLSQSASGSQPTCSSANRGLEWLVLGGTGVADIYQICEKNSSDAYVWTTH